MNLYCSIYTISIDRPLTTSLIIENGGGELKMTTRLKIDIAKGTCCAYGLCNEICPEIYKLDENGFVFTEDDMIPEALEEQAREGAMACPANVIDLVEVTVD
jgi:ferredoxin